MRFVPAGESFIFVLQEKLFLVAREKEKNVYLISHAKELEWYVSTPRFLKDQREKKTKINEGKKRKFPSISKKNKNLDMKRNLPPSLHS